VGHSPLPSPLPRWGGGHTSPTPLGAFGVSILAPAAPRPPPRRLDFRAFGAQRSRSFLFTTQTLPELLSFRYLFETWRHRRPD